MSGSMIIQAMKEAFNCSTLLAYFLTYGSLLRLGKFSSMSLHDFALHNHVEHNASLAHEDAEPGNLYAPTVVNSDMLEKFLKCSASGQYLTAEDIGAYRVHLENSYDKDNAMGFLDQEVSRGEASLILGIFGHQDVGEDKIPLDLLKEFFTEERIPEGWKPSHTLGLIETLQTVAKLRNIMKRLNTVDKKRD